MEEALSLARRGFPAPNPRVGAVVVKEGRIVGRGWHEGAGLPHAEVVALQEAGDQAKGSDLYVTLEPCAHFGKTPPCTDAIVRYGVRRVIFGAKDPNPLASGGEERLRSAGIDVRGGVLAESAMKVNRVFHERYRLGRPFVLVKAAITMDGKIATTTGESRWISDEVARRRAHELRAELGCVLVGWKTVMMDDPQLTVREIEVKRQPLRVVIDPDGKLRGGERVFLGEGEVLRVVSEGRGDVLSGWSCPRDAGGALRLDALLQHLASLGQIGVLVEGGGRTIGEFFRQGLVDEVELHMFPKVLGSGISWVEMEGITRLQDAYSLEEMKVEPLGAGLRISARVAR